MTPEEIKELDDKTLMIKLFDALNAKNLTDFSEKVEVPYKTMQKWDSENKIPVKLPDNGGYRKLFRSLLLIEIQNQELNDYREYFQSTANLIKKYF